MVSVGVVTQDPSVRQAIRSAVELVPSASIAPVTALASALLARPDVLVVDEATFWAGRSRLLGRADRPNLVVVTSADALTALAVAASGVEAVVYVDDAAEHLPVVIPVVARGFCALPHAVLESVLQSTQADIDLVGAERLARLTRREREVLEHLSAGSNQTEVARRLHLSIHTVRFHVKQILVKLGVHSSLEAAMLGARCGVRPAEDETPHPVAG